jgi:hypothetical protein
MARIVHCHPGRTAYPYHIFTDLDFWDARKILAGLAIVRRNFGEDPPGSEFPTQVVAEEITKTQRKTIERRLQKALVSPPRHLIVEGILREGFFEFNPNDYYPRRWSRDRMFHFTMHRLPLDNAALNSPYQTVDVTWLGDKIRIEKVKRREKFDPPVRTKRDAAKRIRIPACF